MDSEVDSTSWDLLDNALILQIITHLCMAKDKASLDALMQTSRAVRALAASSIPSATLIVDHPQCMHRFPAHATIRAMRIKMEAEEAIKFLFTMASEGGSYRSLKMVERVIFMRSSMSEQGDSEQTTKDLFATLEAALPRLRHLEGVDVLHLDFKPLVLSLIKHMPGLETLGVLLSCSISHLTINGFGWAPRFLSLALVTFRAPGISLTGPVLQALAGQMPSMQHLEAYSIFVSSDDDVQEGWTMDTSACAWKTLTLKLVPSVDLINSFSHWPLGLQLVTTQSKWLVLLGPYCTADQVREASARLATGTHIIDSIVFGNRHEDAELDIVSSAILAISSSLTPFISVFSLRHFHVTASIIEAMGLSLPRVTHLILDHGSVDGEAMERLKHLESISLLEIDLYTFTKSSVLARFLLRLLTLIPHSIEIRLLLPSMIQNIEKAQASLNQTLSFLMTYRHQLGLPEVVLTLARRSYL